MAFTDTLDDSVQLISQQAQRDREARDAAAQAQTDLQNALQQQEDAANLRASSQVSLDQYNNPADEPWFDASQQAQNGGQQADPNHPYGSSDSGLDPSTGLAWGVSTDPNSPSGFSYKGDGSAVNPDGSAYKDPQPASSEPWYQGDTTPNDFLSKVARMPVTVLSDAYDQQKAQFAQDALWDGIKNKSTNELALYNDNPELATGMDYQRNAWDMLGLPADHNAPEMPIYHVGEDGTPQIDQNQADLYNRYQTYQAIIRADPEKVGQELISQKNAFYGKVYDAIQNGYGQQLYQHLTGAEITPDEKKQLRELASLRPFIGEQEYQQKVGALTDGKSLGDAGLSGFMDLVDQHQKANEDALVWFQQNKDKGGLASQFDEKAFTQDPVGYIGHFYEGDIENLLGNNNNMPKNVVDAISVEKTGYTVDELRATGNEQDWVHGNASAALDPITTYVTAGLKSLLPEPLHPIADVVGGLAVPFALGMANPSLAVMYVAGQAGAQEGSADVTDPKLWADALRAVGQAEFFGGAFGKIGEAATKGLIGGVDTVPIAEAAARGIEPEAVDFTKDQAVIKLSGLFTQDPETVPALIRLGTNALTGAGTFAGGDTAIAAAALALDGTNPLSEEGRAQLEEIAKSDLKMGLAFPVGELGLKIGSPTLLTFGATFAIGKSMGLDDNQAALMGLGVAGISALAKNDMVKEGIASKIEAAKAGLAEHWPDMRALAAEERGSMRLPDIPDWLRKKAMQPGAEGEQAQAEIDRLNEAANVPEGMMKVPQTKVTSLSDEQVLEQDRMVGGYMKDYFDPNEQGRDSSRYSVDDAGGKQLDTASQNATMERAVRGIPNFMDISVGSRSQESSSGFRYNVTFDYGNGTEVHTLHSPSNPDRLALTFQDLQSILPDVHPMTLRRLEKPTSYGEKTRVSLSGTKHPAPAPENNILTMADNAASPEPTIRTTPEQRAIIAKLTDEAIHAHETTSYLQPGDHSSIDSKAFDEYVAKRNQPTVWDRINDERGSAYVPGFDSVAKIYQNTKAFMDAHPTAEKILTDPNIRDMFFATTAGTLAALTADNPADMVKKAAIVGGLWLAGTAGARGVEALAATKPLAKEYVPGPAGDMFGVQTHSSIEAKSIPKIDKFMQLLGKPFGRAADSDLTKPAVQALDETIKLANGQGIALGGKAGALLHQAFDVDSKGRVLIDGETVPVLNSAASAGRMPDVYTDRRGNLTDGATLSDIAARLPYYESMADKPGWLTSDQLNALREVEQMLEPVAQAAKQFGIKYDTAGDIVDGGFYLPRGKSFGEDSQGNPVEEFAAPPSGRRGGKVGEQQHRTGSQAENLPIHELGPNEAGPVPFAREYVPVGDAVKIYVQHFGKLIANANFAAFMRQATDDQGRPLLEPPSKRIDQNLRDAKEIQNTQLSLLKGRLATATSKSKSWGQRSGMSDTALKRLWDRQARLDQKMGDLSTPIETRVAFTKVALGDAQKAITQARNQALNAAENLGATTDARATVAKVDEIHQRLNALDDQMAGLKNVELPQNQAAAQALIDEARGIAKEITDLTKQGLNLPAAKAINAVETADVTKQNLKGAEVAGMDAAEQAAMAQYDPRLPEINGHLNELGVQLTEARNRALNDSGNQAKWAKQALSLQDEYNKLKPQVDQINASFKDAYAKAIASDPARTVNFPALQQYRGDPPIVASVNKYLTANHAPNEFVETIDNANNFLRTMKASSDASWFGITGLQLAYKWPGLVAGAFKEALKAVGNEHGYGQFVNQFDQQSRASANNAPTSSELVAHGLHQSGIVTPGEDLITRIGQSPIAKASGRANSIHVIKESNQLYSYGGDFTRFSAARAMYDGLWNSWPDRSALLDVIAESANRASGFSNKGFGDWGGPSGAIASRVQFAGRFFQSQLNTLGAAFTDGGLSGAQARGSIIRMFGVAASLTTLFNDLNGHETSYDPRSSNFLRIRVGGQDISLLGPWDTLVRGTVMTLNGIPGVQHMIPDLNGQPGDPFSLMRAKLIPLLSFTADAVDGQQSVIGDKMNTWQYWLKQAVPFSVSQFGTDVADAIKTKDMTDPSTYGGLGISLGAAVLGLKASPMTNWEQYNTALANSGVDKNDPLAVLEWRNKNPDLVPDPSSSGAKKYADLKQNYLQQENDITTAFQNGQMTVKEWRTEMANAGKDFRTTVSAELGSIAQSGAHSQQADWIQSYYKTFNDATDSNGNLDSAKLDAAQKDWLDKNGRAAADYVHAFTRENKPNDLSKEYSDATYALSHAKLPDGREVDYFNLPQFKPGVKQSALDDNSLKSMVTWLGEANKYDIDGNVSNDYATRARQLLLPALTNAGWSQQDAQKVVTDVINWNKKADANPDKAKIATLYPYYTSFLDQNATFGNIQQAKSNQDRIAAGFTPKK